MTIIQYAYDYYDQLIDTDSFKGVNLLSNIIINFEHSTHEA